MKHKGFLSVSYVLAGLLMSAMFALPVFGDETTVNLESRVIDDFSGKSGYTWHFNASKFTHQVRNEDDEVIAEESYPRLAVVEAYPMALYKKSKVSADDPPKSLGILGSFDRRGYNWIDVYPTKNGDDGEAERVEIPLPGRAQYLDMWVWGSNLNYYIEAYIRDFQGVVHTLRFGYIGYTGWKNIRTNIPNSIPQAKRVLPRLAGLTFIKFRIWTQPAERADNFYIYFNQFKILTDTFESLFDGDELADPEYVQELWSNATTSSEN